MISPAAFRAATPPAVALVLAASSYAQPSLTIDLGSTTERAPGQLFTVDSSRIPFTARGGFGGRGQEPAPQPPTGSSAFSLQDRDVPRWRELRHGSRQTGNRITKHTEFDKLPPTERRFVRLTITNRPRIANAPLGITEFTVFGKAVETTGPAR